MVQDHKKSNLLMRIISALVMLPIAIYIILNGGLIYFVLISLLTVLILFEWNGICENKSLSVVFWMQAICSILLMLQVIWGSPYIFLSSISSLVTIIAAAYLVNAKIGWAVLGFTYAVVPSISFLLLYEDAGGEVVLWMMIVIWSMDTGAYFAGKNIGGPKMSPKISPNKTWSGLIGGTITAMVTGYLYAYFVRDYNILLFESASILLILSGLFAILSQLGDLAESALKRKFDVKDSGALIPGHGGIMDRVDGVLFVAPAVVLAVYLLYV